MSKPNWYKENRDEAMREFLEQSPTHGATPNIAVASPIFPTSSEKHIYRKKNGTVVAPASVISFQTKFPYSQLSRGDGACYFNAAFAAILHDCVGDAEKWREFRQGLENLYDRTSFASSKNIADFIAEIDEDKEFPTREKVNEILTKQGDANLVTQLATNLLVKNYGKHFIDSSKEFIIREAASCSFKWRSISGGEILHQTQWNALISEYDTLRDRNASTLKDGERKKLTEALDVRKDKLIKEIVADPTSLKSFWDNVVSQKKVDLAYGLQNLALYETAETNGKLAATYDGNQIQPFFDVLYPRSKIVSISNDSMTGAISPSIDGHPKANTIYLYNPDGQSHFSVLHADLDKRIARDFAAHTLTPAPDTRKPYAIAAASPTASPPPAAPKPKIAPVFTREQVTTSIDTAKAHTNGDPLLYAIKNYNPQVIWNIIWEMEEKAQPFSENELNAINTKINSLVKPNDSLQALADYIRDKIDLGIISQSQLPYQITIAETIGRRPHQQDAIFVGEVQGLAKKNPAEFFRRELPAIIDDHKSCRSGSTLSSAITTKNADGSIDITTANLGDSRAAVTLKYKTADSKFGYRSILLTEDHKSTLAGVNAPGKRVGGLGDNSVNSGADDRLLRTPDIWNFNSNDFLEPGEILEDLDLIVSCDGLWDRDSANGDIMSTDAEFVLQDDKLTLKQNPTKNTSHLTDLRKTFDGLTDKSPYRNNFAFYLQKQAITNGSTDNISASDCTLVKGSKVVIPADKAVMLTVCDGRGGEPDPNYEDLKGDMANNNLVKTANDGALVAASVAARLANAAQIKEIAGLEIQQQKQESLFLLKQQYTKKPITLTTQARQKLAAPIVIQSTTHAAKKKPTPLTLINPDDGYTSGESESDDEIEVSPTLESIKARNKTTFAYTDREIDAVNSARNMEAGYKYFKNKGQESGILFQSNGKPLTGNNGVQTIIEMPACAVDQGSPIGLYLEAQLDHLKEFSKTNPTTYPVKILFPYKLQAWHWNVGEITVTQKGGKLALAGCAYDSMNKNASLEPDIQTEILDTFKKSFPGQIATINHLNLTSASPKTPQRGGIACGLYAGHAMHNLKTKASDQVWDGALKDETILRNEDSALVAKRNPKSNFCAPVYERGLVDIFQTAATSKSPSSPNKSPLSPPKKALTLHQQIIALSPKPTAEELQAGASLLETFAVETVKGNKPSPQKLSDDLKDNPLKKIIFIEGSNEYTTKPVEQLSNLAFEAVLLANTPAISPTATPTEKAYQDCIEVISGSYADSVRSWAISSPSLTEEELKGLYKELQAYINTKPLLSEEKKKELLTTALSAKKMICAEVELARNSGIAAMQEGMSKMLQDPKSDDKSTIELVERFAASNNPILRKNTGSYTPLAAAKERFEELEKLPKRKIVLTNENKKAFHEYAAKGILNKALKANAIEKRADSTEGKNENLVTSVTFSTIKDSYAEVPIAGNLEIQFGRRYVRKNFVGNATAKLKFDDPNFGNNSFANCTFTNCDFSGSAEKQLKFAKCIFNEGCLLPDDKTMKEMSFLGCKFSNKIFDGMATDKQDALKKQLGINPTAVASDGFYTTEPSPSISSGTAFKLNVAVRSH
ncbi:MAG: hypothetical protein V4694_02940 [Pseudomonadota bacterium]